MKIQDAKIRHLRFIAQLSGYIFATKACIDNWKIKNRICFTCPHCMVNFDPPTAEISWGV